MPLLVRDKSLVVIAGPAGSGRTSLAIKALQSLDGKVLFIGECSSQMFSKQDLIFFHADSDSLKVLQSKLHDDQLDHEHLARLARVIVDHKIVGLAVDVDGESIWNGSVHTFRALLGDCPSLNVAITTSRVDKHGDPPSELHQGADVVLVTEKGEYWGVGKNRWDVFNRRGASEGPIADFSLKMYAADDTSLTGSGDRWKERHLQGLVSAIRDQGWARPASGAFGEPGSTRYYDTDHPSPVGLDLHPAHRSAIGLSTDYTSKSRGLVEVGAVVEVERQVRERFRPLDLEVHAQSAEAFELCFFDVTRKHAREAERHLGASGPIDLGTYALRINAGVSSCCTVPLEGVLTLEPGDVVTLSVRNTSKEPARFRANLVGWASQ